MNKENIAKACGKGLPISTKQAIEICNFIRNKELQKAKNMLNDVIAKKIAVPYKRFTSVGHRRGKMAAGRYPIKACTEIVSLLKSAESNAQFIGLNTNNLMIHELIPNKAGKSWHHGRQRRRKMKRTNIDVVLKEIPVKKEEPKQVNK